MVAQILLDQLGLGVGKPCEQHEHETDMILGGLLVGRTLDAVFAHPPAQRKRALAEHYALPIGVDRAPGRSRLFGGADEQTAVLPDQIVVIDALRKSFGHQRQIALGVLVGNERPLLARLMRILQNKRTQRLADEGDAAAKVRLIEFLVHWSPP